MKSRWLANSSFIQGSFFKGSLYEIEEPGDLKFHTNVASAMSLVRKWREVLVSQSNVRQGQGTRTVQARQALLLGSLQPGDVKKATHGSALRELCISSTTEIKDFLSHLSRHAPIIRIPASLSAPLHPHDWRSPRSRGQNRASTVLAS